MATTTMVRGFARKARERVVIGGPLIAEDGAEAMYSLIFRVK